MSDQQTKAIQETWGTVHAKATFEQRVSLKDPPDLHVKGVAYHPYALLLEFVRYGAAAWHPSVLIYTSKRQSNGSTSIRCTTMRPAILDEVPVWLTDIIGRAEALADEAYPRPTRATEG